MDHEQGMCVHKSWLRIRNTICSQGCETLAGKGIIIRKVRRRFLRAWSQDLCKGKSKESEELQDREMTSVMHTSVFQAVDRCLFFSLLFPSHFYSTTWRLLPSLSPPSQSLAPPLGHSGPPHPSLSLSSNVHRSTFLWYLACHLAGLLSGLFSPSCLFSTFQQKLESTIVATH